MLELLLLILVIHFVPWIGYIIVGIIALLIIFWILASMIESISHFFEKMKKTTKEELDPISNIIIESKIAYTIIIVAIIGAILVISCSTYDFMYPTYMR